MSIPPRSLVVSSQENLQDAAVALIMSSISPIGHETPKSMSRSTNSTTMDIMNKALDIVGMSDNDEF